ncbi:helix-turn-helix domain-containing protein [Kineosporia sp. A_224]|uniref:helix-turn-helix domain-containing protein n=1 Tax=Kineosporia sp. A_224 TaxID=1962180 RepID=UPI000B4BB057|nr:helix-turn-helix domain-containing protein [Kineosporia sp. A_224]
MRIYGNAGNVITATRSVDLPTVARPRPASWPAVVRQRATVSPIAPSADEASTREAERTAGRAAAEDARARQQRLRGKRTRATPPPQRTPRTPPAPRPERVALVDELRRRWMAGESQEAIARALGVSTSTVQRLRRTEGVQARRPAVDSAEVVRLYVDEHLALEDVAARLTCSTSSVRYRLRAAGVPTRAPGHNTRETTPDVRAAALARYAAGEPLSRICTDLDVGESSLARWRREAGLPARPRGRPAAGA